MELFFSDFQDLLKFNNEEPRTPDLPQGKTSEWLTSFN
jgi:hypothetical protein